MAYGRQTFQGRITRDKIEKGAICELTSSKPSLLSGEWPSLRFPFPTAKRIIQTILFVLCSCFFFLDVFPSRSPVNSFKTRTVPRDRFSGKGIRVHAWHPLFALIAHSRQPAENSFLSNPPCPLGYSAIRRANFLPCFIHARWRIFFVFLWPILCRVGGGRACFQGP